MFLEANHLASMISEHEHDEKVVLAVFVAKVRLNLGRKSKFGEKNVLGEPTILLAHVVILLPAGFSFSPLGLPCSFGLF